LCGGISYDPSIYRCEMGELIGKCRGNDYYVAYEQCVNGVVVNVVKSSSSFGAVSSSSSITQSSPSIVLSSSSQQQNSSSVVSSSSNISPSSSSVVLSSSSQQQSSSSIVSNSSGATPSSSSFIQDRGTFTDDRDNKVYNWVKIGEQVWMAKNLNYCATGIRCRCYNSNTDYCSRYGMYYQWETAMANSFSSDTYPSGVRGVCPSGWHLPSKVEWEALITAVGGSSTAYSNLISSEGFAAQLGSYGTSGSNGSVSFGRAGEDGLGCWWSTSMKKPENPYRFWIGGDKATVGYDFSMSNWYNVRCLKD